MRQNRREAWQEDDEEGEARASQIAMERIVLRAVIQSLQKRKSITMDGATTLEALVNGTDSAGHDTWILDPQLNDAIQRGAASIGHPDTISIADEYILRESATLGDLVRGIIEAIDHPLVAESDTKKDCDLLVD